MIETWPRWSGNSWNSGSNHFYWAFLRLSLDSDRQKVSLRELRKWILPRSRELWRGEAKAPGMEICALILHQSYWIVSPHLPKCKTNPWQKLVIKATVIGDGVWRIRRKERSPTIEIFKLEETGHGDILSDEFINWRIKLSLSEKETQQSPDDTAAASQMSMAPLIWVHRLDA